MSKIPKNLFGDEAKTHDIKLDYDIGNVLGSYVMFERCNKIVVPFLLCALPRERPLVEM